MKKTLIAAAAGLASIVSFGAVAATPSFDYIQGSYVTFEGPDTSTDGFSVGFENTLHSNVFLEGLGIRVSENSLNMTLTRFGIGYAHNFQQDPSFAIYGIVGLTNERLTGAGRFNYSDNGQYAIAGVRKSFSPNFEIGLSAERYWWDDFNNTDFVAQGRFYLTENLSIRGAYRYEDSDYDGYEVGVAYHF